MKRRQVALNAKTTVAQVLLSGVVLFILYRYLIRHVGIELVGVWSVVFATTSIGKIADLGIGASTTRFVAKALAKRETQRRATDYVQTASLAALILYLVIVTAAYPVLRLVLQVVVPPAHLGTALALLPWALIYLWTMGISATIQGAIDGAQRIDLRNGLVAGSSVVLFVSVVFLVPRYGIFGVAYGQLLQAGLLLAVSWLTLRRLLPDLPPVPLRWNGGVFREMVAYGSQLQVISLMVLFTEPTTKALLSKFGGVASAGYYDMASRLVQQVRGLIVNTNQALVPTIAHVNELGSRQVKQIYEVSYRVVSFVAVPTFCALLGMAPTITVWWTGAYSATLTLFVVLLSVGWLVNVLSGPAYFSGVGTGVLRWNLRGHIIYAVLNVLLGLAFGVLLRGAGVVLGATISLITGSLVTLLGFHFTGGRYSETAHLLLPPGGWRLVTGSIVGSIAALGSFFLTRSSTGAVVQTAIGLIIEVLTIGLISWTNPLREPIVRWVFHPTDSGMTFANLDND